jgi:hypothetical protein
MSPFIIKFGIGEQRKQKSYYAHTTPIASGFFGIYSDAEIPSLLGLSRRSQLLSFIIGMFAGTAGLAFELLSKRTTMSPMHFLKILVMGGLFEQLFLLRLVLLRSVQTA